MSARVYRASIARVSFLLGREFDLDFVGYRHSHRLLQGQDIAEISLIVLSPKMRLILDLNELSADAHAIARMAHGAFEDVIDAQFFANLIDSLLRALILNGRRACDNSKTLWLHLTQPGDHLLGQPFTEILLRRIATEVFKRQYREHDFACRWAGTAPDTVPG